MDEGREGRAVKGALIHSHQSILQNSQTSNESGDFSPIRWSDAWFRGFG